MVVGLAWTPTGGDILFVEATKMKGKGDFNITGQIQDVMRESMQAALSWVRSNAASLGIDEDFLRKYDLHIHVPAGAIPKDGPSAGVTIVTALVSLLTDNPVRPLLAMTGEITLSGNVLPIGGVKEKFLAAKRAGVKHVIFPEDNRRTWKKMCSLSRWRVWRCTTSIPSTRCSPLPCRAPRLRRRRTPKSASRC